MKATRSGNQTEIQGELEMTNSGDEPALHSFPEIRIDRWQWTGASETVSPGTTHSWTVHEQTTLISPSAISASGIFPVFIRKYYSDSNGYEFSAPAVASLLVGAETQPMRIGDRHNAIEAQIDLRSDGQKFMGRLDLENKESSPHLVRITFFTSNNLRTTPATQELSLQANEKAHTTVRVENLTAFPDSRYPVFAVIEWDDHGFHQFTETHSLVQVRGPDGERKIPSWALPFLLGLLFFPTLNILKNKLRPFGPKIRR